MENGKSLSESSQYAIEKTTAYVIGHIVIKDAAKWAEYRDKVPATLTEWRGELVLRGRRVSVFTGEHPYTDTVVIRFPNSAAAESWYGSQAYQALIPLRDQAAEVVIVHYQS